MRYKIKSIKGIIPTFGGECFADNAEIELEEIKEPRILQWDMSFPVKEISINELKVMYPDPPEKTRYPPVDPEKPHGFFTCPELNKRSS